MNSVCTFTNYLWTTSSIGALYCGYHAVRESARHRYHDDFTHVSYGMGGMFVGGMLGPLVVPLSLSLYPLYRRAIQHGEKEIYPDDDD